jgi:hypothetical protein
LAALPAAGASACAGAGGSAAAGSTAAGGAGQGLNLAGAGTSNWLTAAPGSSNFLTSAANASGWGSNLAIPAAGAATAGANALPSLSESQLLAKDTLLGKGTWADLGTGTSKTSPFFQQAAKSANPFYDITSFLSQQGNNMSILDSIGDFASNLSWGDLIDTGGKDRGLFDFGDLWDIGSGIYKYDRAKDQAKEYRSRMEQAELAYKNQLNQAIAAMEGRIGGINEAYAPYKEMGTNALAELSQQLGLTPGAEITVEDYINNTPTYVAPTFAEIEDSEDYQSQLGMLTRAHDRSAAAKGLLNSTANQRRIQRDAAELGQAMHKNLSAQRDREYAMRLNEHENKYRPFMDKMKFNAALIDSGYGAASGNSNALNNIHNYIAQLLASQGKGGYNSSTNTANAALAGEMGKTNSILDFINIISS